MMEGRGLFGTGRNNCGGLQGVLDSQSSSHGGAVIRRGGVQGWKEGLLALECMGKGGVEVHYPGGSP